MIFKYANCTIRGLLTVVPEREQTFIEEMKQFNFPPERSLKLKQVMGYDRHRLVEENVCSTDLAALGFEYLFEKKILQPHDLDALIFVTQTPDYFVPPCSSVLHGRLRLRPDAYCYDINQGCAGFLVGLLQAFGLLDQPSIQQVALVNSDVLSRRVSSRDRNSYPLVGDAASIAIIERTDDPRPIHANLKMDGSRHEALIIPAGGFRHPSSPQTAILQADGENNERALDHLKMDGGAVFNFVQTEVPPLIEELLATAGVPLGAVEHFLFHQPNRFMLQKLADKIGIPHDKVPMNVVEHYGNSSGVTIPMAITHNLAATLLRESRLCCLAGFGVGLTWAAMLLHLGPLDFCEMIEYPNREG